jgi:hypothetical protein
MRYGGQDNEALYERGTSLAKVRLRKSEVEYMKSYFKCLSKWQVDDMI